MRLYERAVATQAVIERFRELPFDWRRAHCIRLAREQAKAMGHTLPPLPGFRSPLGAKRALHKQGVHTTMELLDKYFARWPAPAFARVGDLVAMPGVLNGDEETADPVFQAICVADGQGNLFGWHDDRVEGVSPLKIAAGSMLAAWRL